MKYIHLVLYNKDPTYDEMKEITEKYYNIFDNVTTIYYCYNNDIDTEYKLDDNILYIKGIETYNEGFYNETSILDKTIKAFEFIKKNKYTFDYVIRSNISTIVNLKLLDEELINNPIEYYGGSDVGYSDRLEFKDDKINFIKIYDSIPFIRGICIILSNKGLNFLLNNKHFLVPYMDDVSISILFMSYCDYFKKNELKAINKKLLIVNSNIKKSDIIKNKYIFYRNKDDSYRKLDIVKMKKIISIIK